MAFPTLSFAAVESADNSVSDASGFLDVTVTVPANCKTLVVFWSEPSNSTTLTPAAIWDPTPGVNQALTLRGAVQNGSAWGNAAILTLDNPTPGTAKTLRTSGRTATGFQAAVTVVGYDEQVTVVSNGGAAFTAPAGTAAFDNTISSITTVAGDAVVSCISDDGGTNELAAPGPTFTGGTVYATQAVGSGDSWSGGAELIASGTSTSITWRYGSHAGAFGQISVKYVVLRDASPPGVPSYANTPRDDELLAATPHGIGPYSWATPDSWF